MIAAVRESEIEGALHQCVPSVTPIEPGRWGFTLNSGYDLPVRVEFDADWLSLAVTLPETTWLEVSDPWCVVAANAELAGVFRLSLARNRNTPHLRGDVSIGDREKLLERLQDVCGDLESAINWLTRRETCSAEPPRLSQPEADGLLDAFVERGWTLTERPDGSLMADLNSSTGYYQARIQSAQDEGFTICTEVARFDELTRRSREAIGVVLLTMSEELRMVRPSVVALQDQVVLYLEAALPRRPIEHDVQRGLCALSVACAMGGRELEALQDEDLAGEYLAMTGWRSRPPDSAHKGAERRSSDG